VMAPARCKAAHLEEAAAIVVQELVGLDRPGIEVAIAVVAQVAA